MAQYGTWYLAHQNPNDTLLITVDHSRKHMISTHVYINHHSRVSVGTGVILLLAVSDPKCANNSRCSNYNGLETRKDSHTMSDHLINYKQVYSTEAAVK
jgi:hypothetical protein